MSSDGGSRSAPATGPGETITGVDVYRMNLAFRYPLRTPLGTIDAARNVVVRISTGSGISGWGEASPFAPITGDCQDSNIAAGKRLAELIIGKDALAIEARTREICACASGQPSIRSAFDMALHDVCARAAGMSLFRFLGGERRSLRTDLTIGLQDTVEDTLDRARTILAAGFETIKMKVGRPGLADLAHVRAVRELSGPKISIRIDSNQGWDLPTAIANLNAMKPFNLEYSEQPLPAWNLAAMARLREKVDLPICADESVFDHYDALRVVAAGAADHLNIKLGKVGGIHNSLKINAIAEASGMKCMIGCFGESRLGLSAAAHVAMARANIAFIDLDSAFQFESDPVIGGMGLDTDGEIHLGDAAGLGAEIDAAHLCAA